MCLFVCIGQAPQNPSSMYFIVPRVHHRKTTQLFLVHVRALKAQKTNDPHVDHYHIVTQGHCFSSSSSCCTLPHAAAAVAACQRTPTHAAARRHRRRCRILILRRSQHATAVAPEAFAAHRLRYCLLHVARRTPPLSRLLPWRRLLQPLPSPP